MTSPAQSSSWYAVQGNLCDHFYSRRDVASSVLHEHALNRLAPSAAIVLADTIREYVCERSARETDT